MRVAHVISNRSGMGGAEKVLLDLARAGHSRGFDQLVLNPFSDEAKSVLAEQCPDNIYRSFAGSRWARLPAACYWTARHLRLFRPDIVHVHLFHALVTVAALPRPEGARLVLTHHHGRRYVDEHQPAREALDRICGRRYDAVVAVSESTRQFLLSRYRYPQSKLWVIPNGWSGHPLPRALPRGHRVICIANFRPQKGHDGLLTAFKLVLERVPDAELLLVGDGPLRPQLEWQAQDLGLAARVQFKGQVADIWPLLARADIFALPSRYEPLGLAALEAMAAGLPVVASNVDGLATLVEPGVTGQLVTCGDSVELAGRLVDLLRSPETIAAMSRASQARAQEFRADRMTDGYARLYESLLETGADGARP